MEVTRIDVQERQEVETGEADSVGVLEVSFSDGKTQQLHLAGHVPVASLEEASALPPPERGSSGLQVFYIEPAVTHSLTIRVPRLTTAERSRNAQNRLLKHPVDLVCEGGRMDQPVMLTMADAAHGNENGGNQVGGFVAVADMNADTLHLLDWHTNKGVWRSTGTHGSETQAAVKGFDRAAWMQTVMHETDGRLRPIVQATDSRNLHKNLFSLKAPSGEKRSAAGVAILREGLEQGVIKCVLKLSHKQMVADALTKVESGAKKMMRKVMMGKADQHWRAAIDRVWEDGTNPLWTQKTRRAAGDALSGKLTAKRRAVDQAGHRYEQWLCARETVA